MIIVLLLVGWCGLVNYLGGGSCANAANVTYLSVPRSSGRDEHSFTARKRNLETLQRPQAMECLSRWDSLHHTQQRTMTRPSRGQQFLTSQLKITGKDL